MLISTLDKTLHRTHAAPTNDFLSVQPADSRKRLFFLIQPAASDDEPVEINHP
jgi:hypothetical protein